MFGVELSFKRSIAEVAIIVVGVLIALGVDSLNSHRIDRNIEANYLSRLSDEARSNAELASLVLSALEFKAELLDQLSETVGNGPEQLEQSACCSNA